MVAPAVLVAGLTMAAFAAARARLASFAQERSRADPADVFRRRCCLRRRAWRLARSRKRETALLLQACFDAPVVCGGAREACLVRARHNPRRCCRRVSTPLLFAARGRRNPPYVLRPFRGRAERRTRDASAASCAVKNKRTSSSPRKHRTDPAFRTRWFYRLASCSPRRRLIRFCSSPSVNAGAVAPVGGARRCVALMPATGIGTTRLGPARQGDAGGAHLRPGPHRAASSSAGSEVLTQSPDRTPLAGDRADAGARALGLMPSGRRCRVHRIPPRAS